MAVVVEIARSDLFPVRPGIEARGPAGDLNRSAPGWIVPVHFPDRDLTVCVLPQDLGQGRRAGNKVSSRSDQAPSRPWTGAHRPAAAYARPAEIPDRGLTVGVLPKYGSRNHRPRSPCTNLARRAQLSMRRILKIH